MLRRPDIARDPEDRIIDEQNERDVREKMLDKTIVDSFPSSDPPSSIADPDNDSFEREPGAAVSGKAARKVTACLETSAKTNMTPDMKEGSFLSSRAIRLNRSSHCKRRLGMECQKMQTIESRLLTASPQANSFQFWAKSG